MLIGIRQTRVLIGESLLREMDFVMGFVKTGEQYYEEFHGEKYLHDIYCFDAEANFQ